MNDTESVFKNLMKIKKAIDAIYGPENWSIRKISQADKNGTPSLTLRTELEKVGLTKDDHVIVAVREDSKGKYLEIRAFNEYLVD
ncbi:MAG: hypothetical protein GXO43_02260 [Crenarchaeota archaeon]|nr:hypothetical protein [Thermoproteota archaeon]